MFVTEGLSTTTLLILVIIAILALATFAYFRKNQPLMSYIAIVVALVSIIVSVMIACGEFIHEKGDNQAGLENESGEATYEINNNSGVANDSGSTDDTEHNASQQGSISPSETGVTSSQNGVDINGVLNTDGNWLRTSREEILSEEDILYYIINLTEPGRLDVNINCFADGMEWSLIDENLQRCFFDENIWYGKENDPESKSQSHYLEKGVYYLKVSSASSSGIGKFWIMASLIPSNNSEKEPNNTPEQAYNLNVGDEIQGLLSEQDENDYYCIEITKRMNLKILFQSFMEGVTVRLLNKDLEEIDLGGSNIWYGSLEQAKVATFTKDLQPGKYYIHVTQLEGFGKYSIKLSQE